MESCRPGLGSVGTGTVNVLGGAGVGRGGSAREMWSGRDGLREGWWWTVIAAMASGIERERETGARRYLYGRTVAIYGRN